MTLINDFPILQIQPHGKRLAYLDNAATTQKPKQMIDALSHYYTHENANVHRGVHYLSEIATKKFEETREKVKNFIHAKNKKNCIYTQGTTEGINLIASGLKDFIQEGDEIIVSALEHHSNLVPWQNLCKLKSAILKVIPIDTDGNLKTEELENLITEKTKIISVTHIANSIGTILPIEKITEIAREKNIISVIDAAQSVVHKDINVEKLDCDFLVFSSHKMYGPTGIGVLYINDRWLEKLPPFLFGGEMILEVTYEDSTFNVPPYKFEAGTPDIGNVIAFGATLDYLESIDINKARAQETEILHYATEKLKAMPQIQIIGNNLENKASIVSFLVKNVHAHDVGTLVDSCGVAIRTGHHCAMPTMSFFNIDASVRLSLGIYNTKEDIDQLVDALVFTLKTFKQI